MGYDDGTLGVFDLRTNRVAHKLGRHYGSVLAVQMDDIKVVSGGNDRQTRVFDLRTGTTMWSAEDVYPVSYVKFTDRLLVTGSHCASPSPFDPFAVNTERIKMTK